MFDRRVLDQHRTVEELQASWRREVCVYYPMLSADVVRGYSDRVTEAAKRLSVSSPLQFELVLAFFFRATIQKIRSGIAPDVAVRNLPKDVNEMGLLVIETNINPVTGETLTDKDLRRANRLGKLKLQ